MKNVSKFAPMVAIVALGTALAVAGVASARGPQGAGAPVFEEIDADGDGQITVAEFEAFRAARSASADADGDGFLTQEELQAAAQARQAERQAERAERRWQMLLSRADANDDGKLSVEEMQGFMEDRRGARLDDSGFPRGWDADGDGAVSAEEFQTAVAEMFEHRGERRGGHGGHRFGGGHDHD